MNSQLKTCFASLGGASSDLESPFKIKLTACLRRCLERHRSTKSPIRHNISPRNIQNDCCQGALYYTRRHTITLSVKSLDGRWTGKSRTLCILPMIPGAIQPFWTFFTIVLIVPVMSIPETMKRIHKTCLFMANGSESCSARTGMLSPLFAQTLILWRDSPVKFG